MKILRGPSQIRGVCLTGRLLHRGQVTAPRHLVSPHAHHSQKDLCGFRQLTTISTLMFLGLGGSATGWRAPCARIQMLEAGTPRLTTSRLMYSARACDNCPACCVLASLGSAWTDRATRRKPLSSHQVVRTGQSEAYVTLRSLRSLLSGNCGHTISMPLILTVRSHEASRYAKFSPPSAGYFFAQRWGGCLPSADWGAMRWGQPCHRVGAP